MSNELPQSVDQLLQTFVQLNTVNTAVSGNAKAEEPMVRCVESVAKAWNIPHRRLPVKDRADNLLLTYVVDPSRPWLLFESHMDTVTGEGMVIDPFGGEIRDGKLWGRGSCDTKGTGAAMLWALRQYMQSKTKGHNVALLFAIDEEFGMLGIQSFAKNDMPKLGYKFRGAFIGEPTECMPVVAHNGSLRWKITTNGVAAHSSKPSLGKSAIRAMMPILDALETRYIPSLTATHPLTGKAQCSVNVIRGGVQVNVIPERCEIDVDRRVSPVESLPQVRKDIQALLQEVASQHPDSKATIEELFSLPPLTDASSKTFLPFVQGILAQLNLPTQPVGGPFGTDGGFLGATEVPVVIIGPGNMLKAHTKDEYVELAKIHRGVEMYQAMMQSTA